MKQIQKAVPILAGIQQPFLRHEQLKAVAERLEIDEDVLRLELKRHENSNYRLDYKKNFQKDAIFKTPQSYLSRKDDIPLQKSQNNKDHLVLRSPISLEQAVEKKENELMSLLLLSPDSYNKVKAMVSSYCLQSSIAQAFYQAVVAFEGQWTRTEALVEKLQLSWHQENNETLNRYLSERLLAMDDMVQSYQFVSKGLKLQDDREKLNRIIDHLMGHLAQHQQQIELKSLVEQGRHYNQAHNEDSELEVQMKLKEALARSKREKRSIQEQVFIHESRRSDR